jgi:hypothetical protein
VRGVVGFAEGLTSQVRVIRFPEPVGKHHLPRLGIEGQRNRTVICLSELATRRNQEYCVASDSQEPMAWAVRKSGAKVRIKSEAAIGG